MERPKINYWNPSSKMGFATKTVFTKQTWQTIQSVLWEISMAFDLHTGFRFQIDIPMLNNSDISNCKNNQNRLVRSSMRHSNAMC